MRKSLATGSVLLIGLLRLVQAQYAIDIDLTVRRPSSADRYPNQSVREMLQAAADADLGDWFEYGIGSPVMDLAAAPYGGARLSS